MNLPPHHANAPTPLVDEFYWKAKGIAPVARSTTEWAEFARLLERDQQYMMEVVEKAMLALADCKSTVALETPHHWTIEQADEVRTAYTNLKAYMEQKKGEVKG